MDNGALFLDRRAVALPVPSCEASPLQESSDEFFLRLWAVLPKTGAVAVVGVHAVEHLHRRQNLLPFIERSKVPAWPDPLDGQWLSYDVLETEGGPSFYFPYRAARSGSRRRRRRRRRFSEARVVSCFCGVPRGYSVKAATSRPLRYDQGYESDELEIFRRRDMPEVRRLFLSRLIDEAVWVPATFPSFPHGEYVILKP